MADMPSLVDAEDVVSGMYLISNDLSQSGGFTLTTLGHNEMFFLPSFLEHYRKLGVERFVIIDDMSDDGSRDYLAQQPDVMVIGSKHRYGDSVRPPDETETRWGQDFRVNSIWRKYLLDHFGRDAWSLHVDMDEYLCLPEGVTFPTLTKRLNVQDGEVVWAVMLDVSPATIADLADDSKSPQLDLSKDWYFDARRHLVLRPENPAQPQREYGGMTTRILTQYRLVTPAGLRAKLKWWLRKEPHRFNNLKKPSLLYWKEHDVFFSSHRTQKPARCDVLLPMLHFKYTGALYRKVAFALESKAYFKGSRKYVMLEELLARMMRKNASFLGKDSKRYSGFSDLESTGNAIGLR